MSTAPDTDTAQASAPAPAKRPGRPRTAEQPLTPAQRQKLYKQRKQAQAEQLQRAAQDVGALVNDADHPLLDKAAAEAAQAALVALPKEVLLKALQDCLDVLEGDNTGYHDWRRSMARRIFVTLTQKYDLNREDDENQE